GRIKSFTNAKDEVTNYCYEAADSNGGLTSNCTNPNANIIGNIVKIKTTQSLGNGQTSISEILFDATTKYAYPTDTKSYFNTKNSSGDTVNQVVKNTMTYGMGRGLLKSETNINEKVTTYEYDALGRPTKIAYPNFTNTN